nr:cell division cycle 20.2, cofactor of APC complex-like [Tanacetum cinerariifolium]
MIQHVEEFWRRHLSEEFKKIKEIETKIKDKDQQLDLFKQLYHHYEQKSSSLEDTLRRRTNGEGGSKPAPTVWHEEVQSCLVDQNNAQRTDMACKKCGSRPAIMLWLPCRHLCVCFACDKKICGLEWNKNYKEIASGHGLSPNVDRNDLSLWKYPSMVKVGDIKGHAARVLQLSQSPDGLILVSAGADETIRFWDIFGPAPPPKRQ